MNKNIIKLAQNGDEQAFNELVENYKRELYLIAKVRLAVDADIEDAVQETLFDVYKNIRHLKNENGFKTWIVKVLINNCNDIIRSKCGELLSLEDDMIEKLPDYSNDYNKLEEKYDFLELINFLNEEEKTIMIMRYSQDFSIREISEVLGLNEGIIRTKIYRIKKKIKDNYKNY